MTLHELQIKKFTLMFNNFDVNQDGFVERADHLAVADRVCELRGFKPGTPEHAKMQAMAAGIADMYEKNVDKDGDGKITLPEWLAFYEMTVNAPPDVFRNVVYSGVASTIDMVDQDGDGALSLEEYRLFLKIFHVEADFANEYFPRLDGNGDGKLEKDEVLKHLNDWYMSTDPAVVGNYLSGPL